MMTMEMEMETDTRRQGVGGPGLRVQALGTGQKDVEVEDRMSKKVGASTPPKGFLPVIQINKKLSYLRQTYASLKRYENLSKVKDAATLISRNDIKTKPFGIEAARIFVSFTNFSKEALEAGKPKGLKMYRPYLTDLNGVLETCANIYVSRVNLLAADVQDLADKIRRTPETPPRPLPRPSSRIDPASTLDDDEPWKKKFGIKECSVVVKLIDVSPKVPILPPVVDPDPPTSPVPLPSPDVPFPPCPDEPEPPIDPVLKDPPSPKRKRGYYWKDRGSTPKKRPRLNGEIPAIMGSPARSVGSVRWNDIDPDSLVYIGPDGEKITEQNLQHAQQEKYSPQPIALREELFERILALPFRGSGCRSVGNAVLEIIKIVLEFSESQRLHSPDHDQQREPRGYKEYKAAQRQFFELLIINLSVVPRLLFRLPCIEAVMKSAIQALENKVAHQMGLETSINVDVFDVAKANNEKSDIEAVGIDVLKAIANGSISDGVNDETPDTPQFADDSGFHSQNESFFSSESGSPLPTNTEPSASSSRSSSRKPVPAMNVFVDRNKEITPKNTALQFYSILYHLSASNISIDHTDEVNSPLSSRGGPIAQTLDDNLRVSLTSKGKHALDGERINNGSSPN